VFGRLAGNDSEQNSNGQMDFLLETCGGHDELIGTIQRSTFQQRGDRGRRPFDSPRITRTGCPEASAARQNVSVVEHRATTSCTESIEVSDLLDSWRQVADRDLPVSVADEPGARVLAPRGAIDAHNAGVLPSLVLNTPLESTVIVVDLEAVTFIDTAAVRALLLCEIRLARHGVEFRVRNPQPNVAHLLEWTNTDYLLVAELPRS
jgi:anti-anti-sigma factor